MGWGAGIVCPTRREPGRDERRAQQVRLREQTHELGTVGTALDDRHAAAVVVDQQPRDARERGLGRDALDRSHERLDRRPPEQPRELSAGPDRPARERAFEHVAIREQADQISAADDRHVPHPGEAHHLGGIPQRRGGRERDEAAAHPGRHTLLARGHDAPAPGTARHAAIPCIPRASIDSGASGPTLRVPMPAAPDVFRAYFDFTEEDRELLAELRPTLEKHGDSLVSAFYRHLLSFEPTRRLLRDPDVKERLLRKQRDYLISLAGPEIDEGYIARRHRIGEIHERIGLGPFWYLGAYALYLSLLTPIICAETAGDLDRAEHTVTALQKLILLDAQLAMESYIERRERELESLNAELSESGRELARDLEARSAELRRTTERARAAENLASIGTLVAGLAHEIGTPMGVIQGHAHLLESKVADEQSRWRLRTIQQQIGRISKIIQSLLNMARPRRREHGPVALEPLVENTVAFLDEKLARRHIRVVRGFEPCESVRGDPERLQQLLLNLFLNAADAMPDGGELRLGVEPGAEGTVHVTIADTGAGIAREDLDRVFDPFFTTKPAGEGNGLGLAVVQGIVTDHGGEITVSSEAGAGTRFHISLPVA